MKVINKRSDLKITTNIKKKKKNGKTDLWQLCDFKISYLHRIQSINVTCFKIAKLFLLIHEKS